MRLGMVRTGPVQGGYYVSAGLPLFLYRGTALAKGLP